VTGQDLRRRWPNREGLDDFAVEWNWVTRPVASGFTAVLRVKNEARALPWVLPGVLRATDHVVVVDNGSTDGTASVAEDVAEQLGLSSRLTVLEYPFAVSRCGPEHLATHPESVHSLTYFYNWSFSHVRTRYALKWDGDMVLTDEGEQLLSDLNWQLQGADVAITIPRFPVFVVDDRSAAVDMSLSTPEPWGWRNHPGYTFGKAFDWELMLPRRGDTVIRLPPSVCFELKWLDQDEFDHWSHMEFKETINARKQRELDVYRALKHGAELPQGVVPVVCGPDSHIIDHLRKDYSNLM
jgi:glycosyltransferase involved in cell wall biosynthesis